MTDLPRHRRAAALLLVSAVVFSMGAVFEIFRKESPWLVLFLLIPGIWNLVLAVITYERHVRGHPGVEVSSVPDRRLG